MLCCVEFGISYSAPTTLTVNCHKESNRRKRAVRVHPNEREKERERERDNSSPVIPIIEIF